MALSPEDAAYIVDQFGIDVERPLLTQVSRFDPWKDPLGLIDAYRLVKAEVPEVQLALVGSMAHDDPEGWHYYNRTLEHADGDPDIFILSNGHCAPGPYAFLGDLCFFPRTDFARLRKFGGLLQGEQSDPEYLRTRIAATRDQLRACEAAVRELEGLLG